MMTISSEKMLPAVIVRCRRGWIKIAGRVSFINGIGPFFPENSSSGRLRGSPRGSDWDSVVCKVPGG